MEFLIFSDAHGKNDGISRALARQKTVPDAVIFLGDGLRQLDRALFGGIPLFCVRGNCDRYTPLWEDCPEEQLLHPEGHTLLLTHGAAYGVKSGTGLLERAAVQKGADLALFGHTHEPYLHTVPAGERVGGRTLERPLYLFNPGSIGYGGSFGHLLLTGDTVLFSHGTVFDG